MRTETLSFSATLIAVLLTIVLSPCQSGVWQRDTLSGGPLTDIHFVDSLRGWTVGFGGRIYSSTDGGLSWNPQVCPTGRNLTAVWFIDTDTGFAAGDSGIFLRTVNGGALWVSDTIAPADSISPAAKFSHLYFRDGHTGWTGGDHTGKLRKTTDAGSTWEETGPDGIYGLDELNFNNDGTGWMFSGSFLYRTTDGAVWADMGLLPFAYDISFPSSMVGFCTNKAPISRTSGIGKTTDGGALWDWGFSVLDSSGIRDIFFPDTTSGWLISQTSYEAFTGDERIYHSSDGGASWTAELSLDSAYTAGRLFFLDDRHGWAVGSVDVGQPEGLVLRYSPFLVDVDEITVPVPTEFRVYQNFPNPFNPSTTIRYNLPREGRVTVEVCDVLGREVARLVDGWERAGVHFAVWDGRHAGGLEAGTGVYFFKISAGRFTRTVKTTLVR